MPAGGAPVTLVGANGGSPTLTTQQPPLTTGTNRSGTAGTTSGVLAPSNASRQGLEVQNVSANQLGINEIGGAAAIGSAGTYTIAPGGTFRVRTSRTINVIASAAASAYTATEW